MMAAIIITKSFFSTSEIVAMETATHADVEKMSLHLFAFRDF